MPKYGHCETTDVAATYGTGHIYSVRVKNESKLENGMLIKLGEFEKGSKEIHTYDLPATTDKIYLACTPEIIYYPAARAARPFGYYYTDAGQVARVYDIYPHDRFGVSTDLIKALKGTPQVGNIIVATTNGKYEEKESGTDIKAVGFAAKIYAVELKGDITLVKLFVLKNEAAA